LANFSSINNPCTPHSFKQHPLKLAADTFFVVSKTTQDFVLLKIVGAWESSAEADGVA
jgi:hypothetical protein